MLQKQNLRGFEKKVINGKKADTQKIKEKIKKTVKK